MLEMSSFLLFIGLIAALGIIVVLFFTAFISSSGKKHRNKWQKNSHPENESAQSWPRLGQINESIADISRRLKNVEERLDIMEGASNKTAEQTFEPLGASLPEKKDIDIEEKEDHLSTEDALAQSYNRAIENPERKDSFLDVYRPFRVGVANVLARGKDLAVEPEFRVLDDGDYFVVELQKQNNPIYAMLPRFGLAFQEALYGPGAMGKVFDCINYDSRYRYAGVKVLKPAFCKKGVNDLWEIELKGKLELSLDEPLE
jgi:hypothetical protein